MILMFQKEVAHKMVSNKSSSLMILANNYLNLQLVKDLPPHSFRPIPKVYSSIIVATRKEGEVPLDDFNDLESFLRILYQHRRKQLKNVINVDSSRRAEDLNLTEVLNLFKDIYGKYN
jgi:16S rRNA A1518/A1519 N6-dimethyltransferase RsmA/KsgA/DIM1 with predicted DNA glycosylase/AP lyase activity